MTPKESMALRARAEDALDNIGHVNVSVPDDLDELIHEFKNYQIELELQNDELRRTQQELTESRDRYCELYQHAPVGYLTLEDSGNITDANITAAELLNCERNAMLHRPFSDFIDPRDQDIYFLHSRQIADAKRTLTCRLRMVKPRDDGAQSTNLWVELSSLITNDSIRVVLIDISARQKAEEALAFQAEHDSLTGLINRFEFERRLNSLLERSENNGTVHGLCYLDLDQFKIINDTYGHCAGDELLRQLTRLLARRFANRATFARLGGDEFGLLIENCALSETQRIADEVRTTVTDFRFQWQGRGFRIGVSIGVVPVLSTSGSIDRILSAADSACYAAKDAGRNRVHVYELDDEELGQRHKEMHWVAKIDDALDNGRFQLWSQPIVGSASAYALHGREILLRHVDQHDQIINPGEFLPAVERYGLGARLDTWVVGTVVKILAAHSQTTAATRWFVNLSGASLADEDFIAFISELFTRHPSAAKQICLEITETAAIANISRATQFMDRLRALGCLFALDDFGSGLSSFAYLRDLPVDYLKIDGAFIREVLSNPIDEALVNAVNDVGKVMGKQTIAEHVEDEAVATRLYDAGVDFLQGYYTGRPEPLELAPGTAGLASQN